MKKPVLALIVLAVAGFIAGIVHLFHLRFESGDNYPPYSSLRADPLGTKALFESLDRLLPARRNLQPLSKIADGGGATLFWLGDSVRELRFLPEEYKHIETFVRSGGRWVISFESAIATPRLNRFANKPPPGFRAGPGPTNAPPAQPGDEFADWRRISIRDRWNFSVGYAELEKDDQRRIVPATATLWTPDSAGTGLPRSLPVHTTLHFAGLGPEWRTLYTRDTGTNTRPVIIERRLGRGSIVLSADSYYFSNEALRAGREPALLAWFTGPAREVIFDETHLGVQEGPGIATLARKYRLGGIFAALMILAALYVWRSSAEFLPAQDDEFADAPGGQVAGRDSSAGFINLLRRSIPPGDLMKTCLEQWNTHFAHAQKPSTARLQAMQAVIDAENSLERRQRDPVAMYRRLAEVLHSGGKNRAPGVSSVPGATTGTSQQLQSTS